MSTFKQELELISTLRKQAEGLASTMEARLAIPPFQGEQVATEDILAMQAEREGLAAALARLEKGEAGQAQGNADLISVRSEGTTEGPTEGAVLAPPDHT